jgi:hypothetical protein
MAYLLVKRAAVYRDFPDFGTAVLTSFAAGRWFRPSFMKKSTIPNTHLTILRSTVAMKTKGYIFIDDGYPESADYDSNYICWDPETPGSFERALAEARARG